MSKITIIEEIDSGCADLRIMESSESFFWMIEDGCENQWHQIPQYLYDAIVRFNETGMEVEE